MRGTLLLSLAIATATANTGCFVQVGASYAPSAAVSVQRPSDVTAMTRDESSVSFNVRLGVYLDLAGVGVNYGWYAARAIRGTNGFPSVINPRGNYLRVDVDLPVVFSVFKLRASYAHEQFDTLNVGNGSNSETGIHADGSSNAGGLTIATLGNDLSFNAVVGKYSFQSHGDAASGWPDFGESGWDVDVGFTFRFIPTGYLLEQYQYHPTEGIQDISVAHCGWYKFGGYTCR